MKINLESPLMDFIITTINFAGLNVIFILCCLPIVTIGPSLAALYQVTLKEARGEHGYLISNYFSYFRAMLLQGIVTELFFFVLILFSLCTTFFWSQFSSITATAAMIFSFMLTTIVIAAVIYVFPLMAQFKNSYLQTIKNSFLIALTNVKYTFILLLIQIFAISLVYLFPMTKIFMFLIGFSFLAFCNSWLLNKVFLPLGASANTICNHVEKLQ